MYYQTKVFGHPPKILLLILKALFLMKQVPVWFYLLY